MCCTSSSTPATRPIILSQVNSSHEHPFRVPAATCDAGGIHTNEDTPRKLNITFFPEQQLVSPGALTDSQTEIHPTHPIGNPEIVSFHNHGKPYHGCGEKRMLVSC